MGTFQPDLFNTAEYAELHGAGVRIAWPGRATFQAVPQGEGRFRSPGRAPYGGFDVACDLGLDMYEGFVTHVEAGLRSRDGRSLDVGMPPLCYAECLPGRLAVLCRLGYRVTRQELNQSVAVTASPTSPMRYAARKTIQKAQRAGVQAGVLDPRDHRAAYGVILGNRLRKNRRLSMTFEAVQAMHLAFPDRVRIHGASQGGKLVGAAITVAVNARVLYVYAWGEADGTQALSPVTSLAAHLLAAAHDDGFRLLDLGTSSVDGISNPGLVAFKRSLGARPSLKLWLSKVLA